MKKIILPVLFSGLAFTLAAQETTFTPTSPQEIKATPVKAYNRELGIFAQTEGNGGNQSMGMAGLQYKQWHTEHLGFRVIAAFAQYSSSGSAVQSISGDTVVSRQEQLNFNLPVLGFGIEAQRHFYKKVYLFAAAELKGGYGSGSADSAVSISSGIGSTRWHLGQNVGHRDADLLYVGLTASVGAKIQWSRICLGLEILPVHMGYTNIDDGTSRGGITDLSLGEFSQRFFLHWRL